MRARFWRNGLYRWGKPKRVRSARQKYSRRDGPPLPAARERRRRRRLHPLQAWLGHRNIQHTVRYTELAPDRWFKDFWRG